jgi:hypothetical protein
MKILSYEHFKAVNESIRSKVFKNGMCVVYSKDGSESGYRHYICLTEKDDIKTALDELKWDNDFTDSDRMTIKDDKLGILVCSLDKGATYVLISEVLVNNILYIYDTDLKIADCIKKGYINDISDKCNTDNLVYEKDIDYSKLVTAQPEAPYFNYGYRFNDWSGISRGDDAYDINMPYGVRRGVDMRMPNPLFN